MNRRDALQALFGTAAFIALRPGPLFGAEAPAGAASATTSAPAAVQTVAAGTMPPGVKNPGFDTSAIKVDPVASNLKMLSGPGGNIALYEGAEGLIVVDSGVASRAADIMAKVKAIETKPLRTLVNTHWHFDHVGGNEVFAAAGARIFAHDNVRKRLSQTTHMEFFGNDVPPLPLSALPTVTFEQGISLHPEELQVTHVPPAHTDGDSFVLFSSVNALHTGDLFFNGFYPFIDSSTGGTIDGMIAASDRILAQVNGDTKIIPGHGPLGKRDDLVRFREMLIGVRDKMKPLVDAGKTVEEVIAAKPTAEFDALWGGGFLSNDAFVKVVYLCMKRAAASVTQ